ncbi:unnamed protein product [Rodentolepis nana]|uniref:Uncharacterized protein n=1 Tax=Rodentolepis nana TaxID=102285 RepID=A0A0R3TZW0_RODNA|nr:unnamed protein product [Rodentolepis nana]
MSSDDEIYFDAPEDIDEIELSNLNPLSTPEHECIRNRIESLKKSARKCDQNSSIPPYPLLDSIEPASAVVQILDSSHSNGISSSLTTPRILSRTFPEKGSFVPNNDSDFTQNTYINDFETYTLVRSQTTQPSSISPPVFSSLSFGRSTQPMSSAPEVSLRRIHHPNREDYVKSWSLDAARCGSRLPFTHDRPSHLVSPRQWMGSKPLSLRHKDITAASWSDDSNVFAWGMRLRTFFGKHEKRLPSTIYKPEKKEEFSL